MRRAMRSAWDLTVVSVWRLVFMEAQSDAGSAIVIEVDDSSPPPATSPWTANKLLTNARRQSITRRKRKPMTSPQVLRLLSAWIHDNVSFHVSRATLHVGAIIVV